MRCYEMVLIASPEISDDGHKELLEKVEGILKKKRKKAEKGEILNIKKWGIRRLSAPIDKVEKGRYDLITMKCLPDSLSEVERILTLSVDVLRFQTIRLKEEPVFEEAAEEEATTEEVSDKETSEKETAAASVEPEKAEESDSVAAS